MMDRCPDCGGKIKGAQVCASCGAFDFEGLTSWVCFPCGAQNAHGQTRCTCGRERTMECPACGAEMGFTAETCPRCSVPRFAFGAAAEARQRSEEVQRQREGAKALAVGLLPVACVGILLLVASVHPTARVTGASLVGLSILGEGYALLSLRQARRRLE